MAGSKVLQFSLIISLMIFSTQALTISLTDGKGFRYRTGINVRRNHEGKEHYGGCVYNKTFKAGFWTNEVIIHAGFREKMESSTLNPMYEAKRRKIAQTLDRQYCELLYLELTGFHYTDIIPISEFLIHAIEFQPGGRNRQIVSTGGVLTYASTLGLLPDYQEKENIFEGKLREEIRNIPN